MIHGCGTRIWGDNLPRFLEAGHVNRLIRRCGDYQGVLPPGTFAALKGQTDGIVAVIVAAVSASALVAGAPAWPLVVIALAVLLAYERRRASVERHKLAMLQWKVEAAGAKADMVKSRYRAHIPNGQHDPRTTELLAWLMTRRSNEPEEDK
jgi:hypothetical protein